MVRCSKGLRLALTSVPHLAPMLICTIWLILVNIWTFLCFGTDKRRAIHRRPRLMEIDLLGLAIIGGTIGAFAGRRWYNHKTRKASFNAALRMISVAQLGVLAGLALVNIRSA